jgi:tetratricopeptide (TPR) repeat protein
MVPTVSAEMRKQAGVLGVRCSLAVDERESADEFIRLLNKQFAKDPDVLFVIVHAYSDLSTRTAQDLGRTAPDSIAAHKLNAEALEMQGKWEPAQLEYEGILQKDPNARGIHFLLGRVLLSRPDAGPNAPERAKQEFLKELGIDPSNADADYILGELALRDQNWDEAISRFTQAAKLNPNFAEAQLGLGSCFVAVKKFEEAILPLSNSCRETRRSTTPWPRPWRDPVIRKRQKRNLPSTAASLPPRDRRSQNSLSSLHLLRILGRSGICLA